MNKRPVGRDDKCGGRTASGSAGAVAGAQSPRPTRPPAAPPAPAAQIRPRNAQQVTAGQRRGRLSSRCRYHSRVPVRRGSPNAAEVATPGRYGETWSRMWLGQTGHKQQSNSISLPIAQPGLTPRSPKNVVFQSVNIHELIHCTRADDNTGPTPPWPTVPAAAVSPVVPFHVRSQETAAPRQPPSLRRTPQRNHTVARSAPGRFPREPRVRRAGECFRQLRSQRIVHQEQA